MRRHPGRLVRHHEVQVGVHDADGKIGLRSGCVGRRQPHRHARARPHLRSLRRAPPVHPHPVLGDPVHRAPAADAEEPGHRAIQAIGRRVRRDGALVDLSLAHALASAARTFPAAHEVIP